MSEPFEPTPPDGYRIRQIGEQLNASDIWFDSHEKRWKAIHPNAAGVAVFEGESIATKEAR